MTEPILLTFFGDRLINPEELHQYINQLPPGESLSLDFGSEGPSLEATGILKLIDSWLTSKQLPPQTVKILNWYNPVEFVPYQRINNPKISHMVFRAKTYWQNPDPKLEPKYEKLFGLFIGQMKTNRAVILYQLATNNPDNSLVSLMRHDSYNFENLENLSDWLTVDEQSKMVDWYINNHVHSIDNKHPTDWYISPTSHADMNTSLLRYYQKFAVEIVCETFTMGNAFMPSEKTVRPLMAAKPIIVYGPRYYLSRLRGLGFQTYQSLWDESYDLYSGPQRWALMQKTITTLSNLSLADQHDLLTTAHKIALHNRQRLGDICNNEHSLSQHDYSK